MNARLAPMDTSAPTRVIAVTSGKGGVGKTTIAINLAVGLSQVGNRVVLLDADLGLANVDVLLGLAPTRTLSDVMNGECTLADIMLDGPAGLRLVPAASGIQDMAELGARERAGLISAFSELEQSVDFMVVDTAAGIAANTLDFCAAAQEIVVVVCDDPASITDAYATIKVLSQVSAHHRFRVLVNKTQDDDTGMRLFRRLLAVADRYLNVSLDYAGHIPLSAEMTACIRRRRCLLECQPDSNSGRALKQLAQTAANWPAPRHASGRIEYFVERMARSEQPGRVAQL